MFEGELGTGELRGFTHDAFFKAITFSGLTRTPVGGAGGADPCGVFGSLSFAGSEGRTKRKHNETASEVLPLIRLEIRPSGAVQGGGRRAIRSELHFSLLKDGRVCRKQLLCMRAHGDDHRYTCTGEDVQ